MNTKVFFYYVTRKRFVYHCHCQCLRLHVIDERLLSRRCPGGVPGDVNKLKPVSSFTPLMISDSRW
jgi:hypothetical protein